MAHIVEEFGTLTLLLSFFLTHFFKLANIQNIGEEKCVKPNIA